MNKQYVIDVLLNNGIDANYLDEMDNEIELGGNEWMDVLSEITGKDAYDTSSITDDDYAKVQQFMGIINRELNIRFF
jgi:hypothetical protein